MTVKQLKELLELVPPDAEVWSLGPDSGGYEYEEGLVCVVRMDLSTNRLWISHVGWSNDDLTFIGCTPMKEKL